MTNRLIHLAPERSLPVDVNELIDWQEVRWTRENAQAFFQRSTCGDDECEHVHSHFEEQRAVAFGNLINLCSGDGDADQAGEELESLEEVLRTIFAATEAYVNQPIALILHCPKCHLQHVDVDDETGNWATTRHHRKHLCKPEDGGCGNVWLAAHVPTIGVARVQEGRL